MKKTLVLIFAIVICSALSWGQTPFTKTISVGDGITTYQLVLGFNASGTYGLDPALGEKENPPIPPGGVFDARFVQPRGLDTTGFGVGRSIDIRALVSDCKVDTFKIKMQASTEADGAIIFSWPSLVGAGCGYWSLQSDLSSDPSIKINMLTQTSYSMFIDAPSVMYIIKGDGAQYRTFTLAQLALDGTVAKGKTSYGKSLKATNSQVEFCASFIDTTHATGVNLHVEFGEAVDSATMTINKTFTGKTPVKAGKYDKWNFTGGSVANGDSVVICGYGLGGKVQKASWYWYTVAMVKGKPVVTVQGAKYKTARFTKNILRLPMPNTVNLGEQLFAASFPKGTPLVVGTAARTDSIKYVAITKYANVLASLISNPGKVGKEKRQDANASYFNSFDDAKKGLRMGKAINKVQASLPPTAQQNRLFGEALVLKLNLAFSTETVPVTPTGLGALMLNDATSPFNGMLVSAISAAADHFLTYGSWTTPGVTADQFADVIHGINAAFYGPMDTTSWSGAAVITNGAKAVAQTYNWLVRPGLLAGQNPSALTTGNQPVAYALKQNYPNPFNPTTNIDFTLQNDGYVTVRVFNLLGQEVSTLLNREDLSAGSYSRVFDASNMPSGVYFYRISVSNTNGQEIFQDVKKMVLLK
jgi:hypothetical protein